MPPVKHKFITRKFMNGIRKSKTVLNKTFKKFGKLLKGKK